MCCPYTLGYIWFSARAQSTYNRAMPLTRAVSPLLQATDCQYLFKEACPLPLSMLGSVCLSLYRARTCCHNCCEFRCVPALLCPWSHPPLLPLTICALLLLQYSLSRGKKGVTETFHLVVSILQVLLYILTSVASDRQ